MLRKILRGFRCAALVGAALLGVVSARAEWVEYRDSAGNLQSRECSIVESLGPSTTAYVGMGGWRAVKGDISLRGIIVEGNGHLILCDGASLTIDGSAASYPMPGICLNHGDSLTIYGGDKGTGRLVAIGGADSAGIGCQRDQRDVQGAGNLTICGGNIEAIGNGCAAGIGGSNSHPDGSASSFIPWIGYGNGGTVEIYGGKVTATPGAGYEGGGDKYYGAGIGGAGYGKGGTVIIHGGTVVANSNCNGEGYGIGWGLDNDKQGRDQQLSLQILGGSVKAKTPSGTARNQNDVLQCVTVNCSDLSGALKIEGIANYGSKDIYKEGDYVYLWLPNGDHKFVLSNSDKSLNRLYHVNVNGAPVSADPVSVGFWINNTDVGQCIGDGWTYGLDNVLTINKSGEFVISGYFENNAPQVNVAASGARVVLNGVYLGANSRPALVVQQGVSATLQTLGTSTLSATGGSSAMKVDGTLTVDLAGDADRDTSKINVSSSGSNAVSGGGKLTINDGTFCAQAASAAISCPGFALGQKVVMKAGTSPETPDYKPSYTTKWQGHAYVLVAPALTVTVEKGQNVKDVEVKPEGKDALSPTQEGGSVYRVMKDENVFVYYQPTDEKYLVTGENPVKLTVTKDTTIGTNKLEVSAVQVLADGYHYLESTKGGLQYIDTGLVPSVHTRVECEVAVSSQKDPDHPHAVIFGMHSNSQYSLENMSFFGWHGGEMTPVYNRCGEEKKGSGFFYDERVLLTCFENKASWENLAGSEKQYGAITNNITGYSTGGENCTMYIFALHEPNAGVAPNPKTYIAMKLYSFKIYEGETLARDFVPFKTENGKVCGLYDLVKGKLHFNQATSGEPFKLGRDPRVRYRIWDEKARAMRDALTPSEPIPVTAATTTFEKDKWYVVTNEVSCPTITVKGNAHLILCDGAKLTATGNGEHAGIAVAAGRSLTIYGQTFGTGELEAKGGENCAGIGGGNYAAGGTVTIYGGKVSATGGWNGAGIGGGHSGNGGATTIYGGMVTVTGTGGAAGIGGGNGEKVSGGTVTINGGTVKATGDYQDALPEGYTAVEYIESTAGSNQYINTEYVPKTNTRVECVVAVSSQEDPAHPHAAIFGMHRDQNSWENMSFFGWHDGQKTPVYNRCGEEKKGSGFFYDERVLLTCFENKAEWETLDGNEKQYGEIINNVKGYSTGDANCTLYIFALHEPTHAGVAPNPNTYITMKLYSFRIYEGEKLVRNFVPCVSASGAAGLYDTVEGKFYGNCGKNGDFKTGLPAGYERVEYIESTKGGGQYINTGYKPNNNTRVTMDVRVNGPNETWFGVWDTDYCKGAYSVGNDGRVGGVYVGFGDNGRTDPWKDANDKTVPVTGNRVTVELNKGVATCAGVICRDYSGQTFQLNHSLYLFAQNRVPYGRPFIEEDPITCFGCQIYEGEELKRDFVPCVNTATGEAGLYDTVEGKFYGNAGAGRFTIAGSGAGGLGGKVTINGGNVKGGILGDMPKNAEDSTLCCVRVKVEGLKVEKLKVEGLDDYGLNDVQAIVNAYTGTPELYLWLPPGKHAFTVSDGTTTNSYFAVVSGHVQYMTVEPLKEANVWVNGKDIFKESGTDWSYDFVEGLLTLSGGSEANYVISGISLDGLVRIKVTADANVTFSNATFQASSDAVITVEGSHRLNLSAGNGENAAYLLGDGVNVIKGGSTVVENGSVCLWSTNAVPVDGTFSISKDEIMCVGKEESDLPYVKDYKPSETDRIILVAPRCRLAVPVVEHAAIKVSVQNPNAELPGKTGTGEGGIAVMVYELMLGDAAVVSCTLEENYVWIGNRDVQNITINQAYIEMSRGQLPRIVGEGFTAQYREASVDPDTAAVSYETKSEPAILFDKIADTPGVVGQGAREEEWYVVTGKVRCASVCVTKGRVNLILYPGAELTLQGEDDQPGLGVMSNAWLTIYGCTNGVGTLVASGGSCAAGIGGGGGAVSEGAPGPDAGTITVNGGVVTAIGGDFGAGIGGGPHGKGAHLTVNGGTVFAYGGYDADDIGGGTYGKDGVTVVNGGNVMANSVEAKPVNAANEKLYRVYVVSEKFIPTNDVPLAVVGLNVYDTLVDLNGYGTADVFADDENGMICFYLPNGHYEFTVDRWKCSAEVQDGTASAVVTEERVPEEDEGEGGGEGEGEGEGEGGEDEDPGDVWDGVDYAEVLGIEIGVPVKITVRTRVNWNYRLKRVTFEGGKMVVGDAIDFKTARSTSLTLEDDEPPAGAGFYVVEQSLK